MPRVELSDSRTRSCRRARLVFFGSTIFDAGSCLVLLLGLGACGPPHKPARRWEVNITTQPTGVNSTQASSYAAPVFSLRGALAPPAATQAYSIELQSRLTLEDQPETQTSELFWFQIAGTLSPVETPGERDVTIDMKMEQIRARITRFEPPGILQSFEFPESPARPSDALARALTPLNGGSLRLLVTSVGQVRQVRGVTALTRSSRLTMPTALQSLRGLLTDVAFERLIAAALFPPLPSTPVRSADSWQIATPSSALDACATLTLLTGRIASTALDAQQLPVIVIEAQGPILFTEHCGTQERLVEGRELRRQTLSWNDHSLRQHIHRRLVIELVGPESVGPASAPASAPAPARRVRDETLTSTRAGAATAAISD